MEVRRPSTSLQTTKNVVGCWLVPNYMQTPPTHYSLESSAQVAYMKTHPYHTAWEFCTNLESKHATGIAREVQTKSFGAKFGLVS